MLAQSEMNPLAACRQPKGRRGVIPSRPLLFVNGYPCIAGTFWATHGKIMVSIGAVHPQFERIKPIVLKPIIGWREYTCEGGSFRDMAWTKEGHFYSKFEISEYYGESAKALGNHLDLLCPWNEL